MYPFRPRPERARISSCGGGAPRALGSVLEILSRRLPRLDVTAVEKGFLPLDTDEGVEIFTFPSRMDFTPVLAIESGLIVLEI